VERLILGGGAGGGGWVLVDLFEERHCGSERSIAKTVVGGRSETTEKEKKPS